MAGQVGAGARAIVELAETRATPARALHEGPEARFLHPSSHGHHFATARPASTMSPQSNAITPAHRTR